MPFKHNIHPKVAKCGLIPVFIIFKLKTFCNLFLRGCNAVKESEAKRYYTAYDHWDNMRYPEDKQGDTHSGSAN